jgi:hypothetical protein
LRSAGNKAVQQLMFKGVDHLSIVQFDDENNPVRRLILSFMGVKALPQQLADLVEAQRRWTDPPYSTLPFWKFANLVRAYPIDERFAQMLLFIYRDRKEELLQWPLKQFYAVDLFAYLNASPRERIGAGDFIRPNEYSRRAAGLAPRADRALPTGDCDRHRRRKKSFPLEYFFPDAP